jgi:hypothetical protein
MLDLMFSLWWESRLWSWFWHIVVRLEGTSVTEEHATSVFMVEEWEFHLPCCNIYRYLEQLFSYCLYPLTVLMLAYFSLLLFQCTVTTVSSSCVFHWTNLLFTAQSASYLVLHTYLLYATSKLGMRLRLTWDYQPLFYECNTSRMVLCLHEQTLFWKSWEEGGGLFVSQKRSTCWPCHSPFPPFTWQHSLVLMVSQKGKQGMSEDLVWYTRWI